MSVARKDEPIQGPRTVGELEEAIQETLELLYTGRENVAKQAMRLCLPMERLKELFNQYVADRPIDVNDCLCYNSGVKQTPPPMTNFELAYVIKQNEKMIETFSKRNTPEAAEMVKELEAANTQMKLAGLYC